MARAVSRPAGPDGAQGRTILPPEAVLRTAKRVFMATGTLEMRALARELGIGRATLYRWNRGRDELLSAVLVSLAEANMRRAEGEVDTPPGALRVCHVHDLHLRLISGSTSLRAFVRSEPQVASRLLLDVGGTVHLGAARTLADFMRRQQELSEWRAPLDVDQFAHVVARMSETYIYADLIAHGEPETETPDIVLRLMLGLPVEERAR